jgi:hypothetical protein
MSAATSAATSGIDFIRYRIDKIRKPYSLTSDCHLVWIWQYCRISRICASFLAALRENNLEPHNNCHNATDKPEQPQKAARRSIPIAWIAIADKTDECKDKDCSSIE